MAGLHACRRFQCNVCGMLTEVPLEYYCAVDGNGVRHDIDQRPELSQGSVEYIAPQEYMVRSDLRCLGYAPWRSPWQEPKRVLLLSYTCILMCFQSLICVTAVVRPMSYS